METRKICSGCYHLDAVTAQGHRVKWSSRPAGHMWWDGIDCPVMSARTGGRGDVRPGQAACSSFLTPEDAAELERDFDTVERQWDARP